VKLLLSLALVVLVLIAYWPCFHYPFLNFDDTDYITRNEHVQSGLTEESIRWAFTTGTCGNWHPLTWLSLQLDRTLYGEHAGGFHRTNVLLHLASTLVLFLTLVPMTGQLGRSWVVGALFALHPLNVQPVAWVAERKGVLSTFFWMLSLAAYLAYVRRPVVPRYLLILLTLALGLMAKPALVTLPFALLLLDYWPLDRWQGGRAWRSLVVEKLPLLFIVMLACVVAYLTQQGIGALPSLEKYSLTVRSENAVLSYVAYIGNLIWPLKLAAYYPHPGRAVSLSRALAAVLLLGGLTYLVLGPGRRFRYLRVGWLWYLGTAVPTIGLVQIGDHGMADRYVYAPAIGLFLLLTWGGADLAQRMKLSFPVQAVVVAAGVILCSALTRVQLGYWKSDKALWEHALEVTENNAFAHAYLILPYTLEGHFVRAEREAKTAVAIDPEVPKFQHMLGELLQRRGRYEEALTALREASSRRPWDSLYHLSLADTYRKLGRNEEALSEYQAALALAPENPLFHCTLANLLSNLGRHQEAQEEYRQAIELSPTSGPAHAGLGKVLAELGQHQEACAEYRQAIELSPQDAVAHYNFAWSLQAEGRLEEAASEYRKALDLGVAQAASQWQTCERLRKLQPRLQGLLAGQDQPANNSEFLGFAQLCEQPFVRCYDRAVHLYTEAFRKDPALADDMRTGFRTAAAIAAARAGCGQGRDAAALKDEAKAQLRRQSLEWLQAELARWRQWADRPDAHTLLVQTLREWTRNDGLSGVREPAALARLPEDERVAWRKLWQEVEALLTRPNRKRGPNQTPNESD
jgi:tetratricopeptide (TPR) repeat protein